MKVGHHALKTGITVIALCCFTTAAFAQEPSSYQELRLPVILSVIAIVISIPAIVAFVREHPNRWPIF